MHPLSGPLPRSKNNTGQCREKLKTYLTSQGFYDLAIAASSRRPRSFSCQIEGRRRDDVGQAVSGGRVPGMDEQR
jgi:hypothetical protein